LLFKDYQRALDLVAAGLVDAIHGRTASRDAPHAFDLLTRKNAAVR
jgi:hypothetical protein